jgi:oleandomycin transport system ATP-binding protein
MIGRLLGMPRPAARGRAEELLERLDLTEAGNRVVRTYSGGMRRRLDLAASLMGQPLVLFLDEPTTGLDPQSRTEMWRIVRTLMSDGTTVLLTTQYLEEADQVADDVVVIDGGKVVASGKPDQLKAAVGEQVVEITPLREHQLDAVVKVMSDVVRTKPEVSGGKATVTVSDPVMLAAIVRGLDEFGVTPSELTLRKPTLDEVFLALTGDRGKDPHD